ncbi:hypothetical protein QQF64_013056 [Cirrhinus molitorella]|uniref:Uncharacterized protein n=1 Tax=Cirrhinus molitorella TaxID=172907 RepID=A0ABR3LRP5_9TELE
MTKPSDACYSTFLTQTQVVQAGGHVTPQLVQSRRTASESCQHLDPSGYSPDASNRIAHIKPEGPISRRPAFNPVA